MDVNIELYRVFYWIAKEKNITKTAEKLFVSQSAVTQSLKKLEEQLGGTLFIRNKKGVELTDAGEKLYNYIESSINVLNNAENMFSQYTNSDTGTVRICGGASVCNIFLADLVEILAKKYPHINLTVEGVKTKEGQEKLLKNEIDMLIIEEIGIEKIEGIEIIPIMDFEFCFFSTPEYLENMGGFNLNRINDYFFVTPQENSRRRIELERKLKEKNLEIEARYEFRDANLVKNVVRKAGGIGYANELIIADKLKSGELVKIDLGLETSKDRIVVAIRDVKKASNAVIRMTEIIKDIFQK